MRDPHQLFLRLESQVREFVIEMKVKLLKQLSTGFKTPPQAKKFISMLLEEYTHLCTVARKMSGLLKELVCFLLTLLESHTAQLVVCKTGVQEVPGLIPSFASIPSDDSFLSHCCPLF